MFKALVLAAAATAVLFAAIGVAGLVLLATAGDAGLETTAPTLPSRPAATPVSDGPNSTATEAAQTPSVPPPATPAPPPPTPTPEPERFVIDSSQSLVTLLVITDVVAGLGSSRATATTADLRGEVYLTPTGLATGEESSFRVDQRTFRSNDIALSLALDADVLDARRFPYSTFSIESLRGLPAVIPTGDEISIGLTGTMTVRGISRPTTWSVKLRRSPDVLTALADTEFRMTDFGITPPNLGIARARDMVHLQVRILAVRQP